MPSRAVIPGRVRAALLPIFAACATAAAYYVGAMVGFALTLAPVPVSTLWPPNAILLSGLLLTRARNWPLVLGAVFVAHIAIQAGSGVPAPMVLCWFVSNSLEALIGAVLLQRFGSKSGTFDTIRGMVVFIACVGLAAPFISSFVDAAFVVWNRWGSSDYWTIWRTRFWANVLADVTIVPVVLTSADGLSRLRQTPRRRVVEAIAASAVLCAVCWVVFVRQHPGPATLPVLLYTPLPLLVGAAIRFGPWGASVSMLTCALIAIRGAVAGHGPFVASTAMENALAIQLFLIIAWVPVMSLACVIRERAHANASARSSEEQLAVAIDAAQLGRWEFDVTSGRLIWSDITRRIYEVPPDAPVGVDTFQRLIHPDDRHLIDAATASAVAGGEIDVEFRVRFPDGRIKWIHSKGKTVFDEDGRPNRIVGVKVDVTRRKAVESQIHAQRQQLAHVSRVSVAGEMSIALAHEMNQPLAAILANAAAARRFLQRQPPDLRQLAEIVEAIAHDNRRAAAIVSRFNELQARDDAEWVSLDLNDLVCGVIAVARSDIYSRGVSLTTRLAPALPRVLGDAIQLQQVVLNLLVNACDAMDSVDASRRQMIVATSAAADGVSVTVTDTGTGVPEEERDRIFEPFVTTKPQRLGLGLAICRSIVSAHGGALTAENLPHGGASFGFSLPGAAEQTASQAASA